MRPQRPQKILRKLPVVRITDILKADRRYGPNDGSIKHKKTIKHHYSRVNYKDKIMQEVYNGWIKFNLMMEINGSRYNTSVTLKKNIVALWLVMMEKIHCDHNRVILDFIEEVVLKRWEGNTARGLGDFILKCMIHSILDKKDYEDFKLVYLALNGRVNNPRRIVPAERRGQIQGKILRGVSRETGNGNPDSGNISDSECKNLHQKNLAENKKRIYIRKNKS
jgi:hypothetical protein